MHMSAEFSEDRNNVHLFWTSMNLHLCLYRTTCDILIAKNLLVTSAQYALEHTPCKLAISMPVWHKGVPVYLGNWHPTFRRSRMHPSSRFRESWNISCFHFKSQDVQEIFTFNTDTTFLQIVGGRSPSDPKSYPSRTEPSRWIK
jgi:hypothetical protein